MVRSILKFIPMFLLAACLLACTGGAGGMGGTGGAGGPMDGVGGNPAAPTLGDMGADVEDTTVVHCEEKNSEGECIDTSYKNTIQNPGGDPDPDPDPKNPTNFKMNALPPDENPENPIQGIALPTEYDDENFDEVDDEEFEAQFAF